MTIITETPPSVPRVEPDAQAAAGTVVPSRVVEPAELSPVPAAARTAPRQPTRRPRPHPHRVARLVTAGVVAVVVGGIAFAMRPKPVPVDTVIVSTGAMSVTVDVDAVTRVRDRFAVTAPVGGMVQRSSLREGDAVRAGDVVATIVTPPVFPTERQALVARVDAANAARLEADARVAQATQALAQATRDDGRARALLEAGGISDRDAELAALTLTNRRTELRTAEAQRRIALAGLTQAQSALAVATGSEGATTLVRAPASGRVLGMPERSARVVSPGTQLLTLGDPRTLEIAADVLSSDAASLRRGQTVILRGWGGAPLRGVVRSIEPSARTRVSALGVEEQRLTAVIDLPNAPTELEDGYRLDASIVVWDAANVPSVPAGALLRSDDGWRVFVVREGRAERVPVNIGHVGGGRAEVLGGVRRGERVILFPPDALRDGAMVRSGS
jgi:HlyD family secretion protein